MIRPYDFSQLKKPTPWVKLNLGESATKVMRPGHGKKASTRDKIPNENMLLADRVTIVAEVAPFACNTQDMGARLGRHKPSVVTKHNIDTTTVL